MDATIELIKGIHPGIILERELKKRNQAKGRFALLIQEFPQTLTSITKGKRRMNPALSLKIEHALNLEEGYFMVLQAYYDIQEEKKKISKNYSPDLTKIRPVIFWDTEIQKIDWDKNKVSVVLRIFERGNEMEINEIIRFYGKEIVVNIIENTGNLNPLIIENKQKYLS